MKAQKITEFTYDIGTIELIKKLCRRNHISNNNNKCQLIINLNIVSKK